MFEHSSGWSWYYRELDPGRRKSKLEELCASEPDDGANEYRRALFQARHTDPKRPGHEVDRMLFMCVSFMQLCQSALLFRKGSARDVRQALKEQLFDQAPRYGEAGTGALYWEIRNAAARYLSTCSSSGYNRRAFGLVSSRPGGREDRIVKDLWQMSEGLTRRTGLENELALWNRAIRDAYSETGENAGARFEAYSQKMSKR